MDAVPGVNSLPRVKLLPRLSPTSWLTTKTVFSQAFAVGLFAIQAPILGPRAFGLISLVMVFVGFCEFVLCEVAADSLISVREIEQQHFDTMTGVIVAVSLFSGAVILVGADWFGSWFGDAQLAPILRWMSVLPVLTAVSAAPTAATKREMQFGPLALRSIVSMIVGGTVGLVLTLTGFGVWALVWQALVTRVVIAIVLWRTVPLRFGIAISRRHCVDLARFALPTLLSKIMAWSANQVPRLVLGLFWGPAQLGLFSLAGRLSDILMEVCVVPRYAVARVQLRGLANDAAGLATALRQVVMLMSIFCFPLGVGGAVVAPTLFHVWLDPRWFGGIAATQFLFLACVAQVTHYCAGATLLALNQQKAEAGASIAQTATTVLACIASAPFGITAASAVIAARPFAMLPLPVALLKRRGGLSPRIILGAQVPAFAAAVAMGLAVWLLRVEIEPLVGGLATLPLLVIAGAGVYVLAIAVLKPGLIGQFVRRPQAAA